jgi:hypothetical protein
MSEWLVILLAGVAVGWILRGLWTKHLCSATASPVFAQLMH